MWSVVLSFGHVGGLHGKELVQRSSEPSGMERPPSESLSEGGAGVAADTLSQPWVGGRGECRVLGPGQHIL